MVLGQALFKVLAAFFFPFLPLSFKPFAPALVAFSMFLFASVPGSWLLLCKCKAKWAHSSESDSEAFLLEEEAFPAKALFRPPMHKARSKSHLLASMYAKQKWKKPEELLSQNLAGGSSDINTARGTLR